MYCPKCGINNSDQHRFCVRCGAKVTSRQPTAFPVPQVPPPVPLKFNSMFVSPDEQTVAVLGNSMAQTFLATGNLSSSFAVLSNKRVYFHGKAFVRNGKRFSVRQENRIVDVQDITGTGFIYNNPIWIKILAIFFSIVTVAFLIIGAVSGREGLEDDWILPLLPFIATAILFIVYCAKKHTLFEISFAGGGIAFNVVWFPQHEAHHFQNALKQTSDSVRAQIAQQKSTVTQSYSHSAADEIEKLSKLLSQGLLSREEFELHKRSLISSQSKNNMQ